MPERSRWLSFCRLLAPAGLRERAFDPAVHDIVQSRALRTGGRRPAAGARLREAASIFAIAVECRRLAWTSPARHRDDVTPVLRGDALMTTWLHAVRYALRRLRREPLFALVAVSTLALGIGANVAVFSFVNAFLVTPFPVPAAQEVIRVYGRTDERPYDVVSYPTYRDITAGVAGLDLAAHGSARVLVGESDTVDVRSLELVTGNYFRVLRLTPVVGRFVEARDDVAEGSGPVVVLAESFWRARFAADRDIVGRTIRLNGTAFEVIGVAPATFHGTEGAFAIEMWAPITMQQTLRPRGLSLERRGWGWLRTIGRLTPGTHPAQVESALARVAADLKQRFPKADPLVFVTTPASVLEQADRRAFAPVAGLTFAFTALLLLVTCANLAGVMQARAVRRRREMAVRYSLGAGRSRLLLEWLAECVVLAGAGGLAGLVVARLAVAAIVAFRPPAELIGNLNLAAPFDWRVLLFAAGASLVSAVMFGLWPAVRASAAPLSALLKEDAATTTGGRRGARLRRAAVLVQVAASAVLLVAAALLTSSLGQLQAFDPGFRTDNLALVSVDLGRLRVPDADANAFRQSALAAVRALPGVASADVVRSVPLMPGQDRQGFRIPGYTAKDGTSVVSIDENTVGAGYFATMGIPFVRGGPWDASGQTPGLVVNETMARRFWADRDPVGQSIEVIGRGAIPITGIVRDSAYYQLAERPIPFVFLPAELKTPKVYTIAARTTRAANDVLPAISRAVASADPRVKPYDATTFVEARQVPLYPQKLLAASATIFGGLALLLTGVGLYGVVSTSVGQRTREIGVRMALGARAGDLQAGVIGESFVLVAIGAGAGLLGGYALAGALENWLFGVAPFDPGIYAAVVTVLAALALVAAWAPARRAARVDPVVALRS